MDLYQAYGGSGGSNSYEFILCFSKSLNSFSAGLLMNNNTAKRNFIPELIGGSHGEDDSSDAPLTFNYSVTPSYDNIGRNTQKGEFSANQTFRLKLYKKSFSSAFVNKKLQVSFKNYSLVLDLLENKLSKDMDGTLKVQLEDYSIPSDFEESMQNVEKTFNWLMALGAVATALANIVIGSSLENLWLAVEGLQQLYFLQYTELQYVKNFKRYCDFFDKFAVKKGYLAENSIDTKDWEFKDKYVFKGACPKSFIKVQSKVEYQAGAFYLLNNEPFLILYIFSLITYFGFVLLAYCYVGPIGKIKEEHLKNGGDQSTPVKPKSGAGGSLSNGEKGSKKGLSSQPFSKLEPT